MMSIESALFLCLISGATCGVISSLYTKSMMKIRFEQKANERVAAIMEGENARLSAMRFKQRTVDSTGERESARSRPAIVRAIKYHKPDPKK